MTPQDLLDSLADTLGNSGVDLSSITDAAQLAEAMNVAGLDASALSDDQLDYLLDNLRHADSGAAAASTGAAPVKFAGWEKSSSSGYWYEYDPDGNYTGRWSS